MSTREGGGRGGRGRGRGGGGGGGGGGGPRTRNPPRQQQQQQRIHPQNQQNTSAPVVVEKRKPVFIKIDQLKPGTNGHNLVAKVLSCDTVKPSSNQRMPRISECLVGDETGTILFTARNEQGPLSPSISHVCFSS